MSKISGFLTLSDGLQVELGALDGLSVLQHGLLELRHQPGEVVQRGHVVVSRVNHRHTSPTCLLHYSLHAGRSVAGLDADVHVCQLLATRELQLVQLQPGIRTF